MIKYGISAIIFLVLATSCGSSEKLSSSNVKTSVSEIVDSMAFVSVPEQDTLVFQYQYFRSPRMPWQDTINRKIGDFACRSVIFEYDGVRCESLSLSPQFFLDQLNYFRGLAVSDMEEAEYPMGWAYIGGDSINLDLEHYVQLQLWTWTFTGGAHGNGVTFYSLISKATGETISLDELTSDPAEFTRVAETYFRREMGLQPDEDLEAAGFWFANGEFACNDNFFIDRSGITFVYNSYEIAPYAFGNPQFTIPWEAAKPLLAQDLSFAR